MSTSSQFDFSRFDYFIDPNSCQIVSEEKKPHVTGKSEKLIQQLFDVEQKLRTESPRSISSQQVRQLQDFSKALEIYLEQSLCTRYVLLGSVIIWLQKKLQVGVLPVLLTLEKKFAQIWRKTQPSLPGGKKTSSADVASPEQPQGAVDLKEKVKAPQKEVPLPIEKVAPVRKKTPMLSLPAGGKKQEAVEPQSPAPPRAATEPQEKKKISPIEEEKKPDLEGELLQQLTGMDKREHGLEEEEKKGLAHFIAEQCAQAAEKTSHYFKKTKHNIARTFVIDAEAGTAYLRSKRKEALVYAEGSYKKVTSAVSLNLRENVQTASIVAQAVTKDSVTPVMMEHTRREMRIHQSLKGAPGIWPLHFWFEYKKGAIEKISAVMDLADNTLSKMGRQGALERQLEISRAVIQGVHSMHSRGYVHGDLKSENVLVKEGEEGLIAGLCDFGFAFKVGEDVPSESFKHGSYATLVYTAPEVYSKGPFDGDFFKADIWALGTLLYELHFQKEAPWQKALTKMPKEAITERKAFLEAQIQKNIEQPLEKLQGKETLSKKEQFEALIYRMLLADPTARIDSRAALEQIEKIYARDNHVS